MVLLFFCITLQTPGKSSARDNQGMSFAIDTHTVLDLGLSWHNSFAHLGSDFYTPLVPLPLPSPYWVGRSKSVAHKLGLPPTWCDSPDLLQALSGNTPIAGTQPLASVYSGHQFGQWAGQLGDGRAVLLGETRGLEVQLKGSGRTPYSRMGDGRAVLRSSIREFLCSEAMYGLGIATTRALCVAGSALPVRREALETGAVVTRVAPSFLRFGHFEHFAHSGQHDALRRLVDFTIASQFPQLQDGRAGLDPLHAWLGEVVRRTAAMVAHWQAC